MHIDLKIELQKSHFKSIKNFWQVFFPYIKYKILGIIFFSTALNILYGLVSNYVIGLVVESISQQQFFFINKNEILGTFFWLLMYVTTIVVAECGVFICKWMNSTLLPLIDFNIRISIMQFIYNLSFNFFKENQEGAIENTIDNLAEGSREAIDDIINYLFPLAIFILFSLAYLCYLNLIIGLMTLIELSIFFFLFFRTSKQVVKYSKGLSNVANRRTGITIENIQYIIFTKIFSVEKIMINRLSNVSKEEATRMTETMKSNAIANTICASILITFTMATLFFSIYFIKHNILSIGKFITIVQILFFTIMTIWEASKQLIDILFNMGRVMQSITNIAAIEERKYQGSKIINKIEGNISVHNLSFYYKDTCIFKNLSFSIKPRSKVLIIGSSGIGKSSLLRILSKLERARSGDIFIDFDHIDELNTESLLNKIAYIEQKSVLLNISIMNNLLLGNPNASQEEVIQACNLTKIHDFVMQLPQQYDTIIFPNGNSVSVGQAQRLCIARALLRKPDLFLCDEIASALDIFNAINIFDSILNMTKDKTVIFIDHMFIHMVNRIDQIIFLQKDPENDNITCFTGTHQEMLIQNEQYNHLFSSIQL